MKDVSQLKEMDYKFTIDDLKTIVNLDIVKVEQKMPNHLIYTYIDKGEQKEHRANYFEMLHIFRKENNYPCLAVPESEMKFVIFDNPDTIIDITKNFLDFIVIGGEAELEYEAWNKKYRVTITEIME